MFYLSIIELINFVSSYNAQLITVRLLPGMDLKIELLKIVKSHKFRAATIVSCVGTQ